MGIADSKLACLSTAAKDIFWLSAVLCPVTVQNEYAVCNMSEVPDEQCVCACAGAA